MSTAHPHKGVRGLEIYHFGEAKDQRALEVAARENGTPLNNTGVGWEYLVADLLTSKKIEHSLELAWTAKQAMVTNLNGRYSTIDHGVKTAPFYVLRFTTMPASWQKLPSCRIPPKKSRCGRSRSLRTSPNRFSKASRPISTPIPQVTAHLIRLSCSLQL